MRFWSHNKPSLIHKEIDLRQAERKSILPHKHLIYILIRFAYSWEVCAYTLATLQINTRRKYKIKMKALPTFGALRVSLVLQLLSKPSRWKKRHRRLISAAFGQKPRKPFGTADDDCCEWQYLAHTEGIKFIVPFLYSSPLPLFLANHLDRCESTNVSQLLTVVNELGRKGISNEFVCLNTTFVHGPRQLWRVQTENTIIQY